MGVVRSPGFRTWKQEDDIGGRTYFLPQVDGLTHTHTLLYQAPAPWRYLAEVEWEALA